MDREFTAGALAIGTLGLGHVTKLYFEAHITLDPDSIITARKMSLLQALAKDGDFRVADFLMAHENAPRPKPFLSCRDTDYDRICRRIEHMCTFVLTHNNFRVLRYKIENTLVDSNHETDPMGILGYRDKWLPSGSDCIGR